MERDVVIGPLKYLIIVVALAWPSPSLCEVFRDSVLVETGSWVFSRFDCGCPPCETSCDYPLDPTPVDLRLIFVFDPPLGQTLVTDWGGQALGDVHIDSVLFAPTSGYLPAISAETSEEITPGHTYVLRTMDGGHALVYPLSISLQGMAFVYKYQDNGSGVFDESVPVKPRTWGRIKAMYAP